MRGDDLVWNFCLYLQYEISILDEIFGRLYYYQVVVKINYIIFIKYVFEFDIIFKLY